jgi:hypothetical protein
VGHLMPSTLESQLTTLEVPLKGSQRSSPCFRLDQSHHELTMLPRLGSVL